MKTRWSIWTAVAAVAVLAGGGVPAAVAEENKPAGDEAKTHFYIWGEVKSPGAFPWKKDTTVAQAIQQAGGLTERANRSRATLTRGAREITLGRDDLLGGERKDATTLEPGDTIRIEAGAIRVEGEVRRPGDYGMEHNTLRQALIAAGGPTEAADLDAAYIARGGQVVRVDARATLTGGATALNPALEPGDVLHVPKKEARVTIAGEVRSPGSYNLESGKLERLQDLMAAAGGPTARARLDRVEVRRAPRAGEKAQSQVVNTESPGLDELQRNPVLQSGDYVVVPGRKQRASIGFNEVYQVGILVLTLFSILR